MDSETQDLLLQKLEETVIDENNIVTLSSAVKLFQKYNTNIQQAKSVLSTFVKDHSTTNNLDVMHVITGVLKNGSLSVKLSKQEDLENVKALFKEISHEQVYSIGKTKSLDEHAISLVDNFDKLQEKPHLGAVVGKNCIHRVFKVIKPPAPTQKEPVVKGKSSFFVKSEPDNKSKSENDIKNNVKKSSEVKALPKPKSSQSLAGMFSKMSQKPPLSKTNSDTTNSQNSISSEDIKMETDSDTGKSNSVTSFAVSEESENDFSQPKVKDTIKNQTPKAKDNKNKRQRSSSKKTDQTVKRRKRIVETNDSDSDDIFGGESDNEKEEITEDFEEELKPVTITQPATLPPKNKKRKLVDKTFEDEDGFILTTKEWVYESGSDDEEKEQKKPAENKVEQPKPKMEAVRKEAPKSTASDKPENGKGKKGKKNVVNQPTLMNFFKRK